MSSSQTQNLAQAATMDTAGTIIGAISLSITLCQGITTYCHDWKHQDEEVRSLRSLCDGLV